MSKHSSAIELRNMDASALRKEAAELKLALAKLTMGVTMRSEKDTAKVKKLRREHARVLTVLGEKEKTATISAPRASKKTRAVSRKAA